VTLVDRELTVANVNALEHCFIALSIRSAVVLICFMYRFLCVNMTMKKKKMMMMMMGRRRNKKRMLETNSSTTFLVSSLLLS